MSGLPYPKNSVRYRLNTRKWADSDQRWPLYRDRLSSANPARVKAVGHPEGHDNRRYWTRLDMLCVNNQALALILGLVVDEAHEVSIIF